MEQCFAGNMTGARARFLGVMGNLIEVVVMIDYLEDRVRRGGTVDVFPSPTARDFFDLKGDRCDAFATFLSQRNPFANKALIEDFCRQRKIRDGDKTMVPDFITHDGTLTEVYEVKPAPPSGRDAGRKKLRNFCELSAGHGLPYCQDTGEQPGSTPRGHQYSPNYKKVFWTGVWAGVPARVSLQFYRDGESMILYKFCVEINAETVSQAAMLLCIRAAIVMVILTRGTILVGAGAVVRALLPLLRSPLLQSVGTDGRNDVADTRYVQRLLNDWRGRRNLPLLVVDGLHGRLTNGAITEFQTAETGAVDGRVDAGGLAIRRLEELHLEELANGVASDFLDHDHRRTWLDDVTYAMVLAAPGNEDPPSTGAFDPTPIDVFTTAVAETQEYLQALRDEVF